MESGMCNGLSHELAALHELRADAERKIRERLFGWLMEHGDGQTIGAVRKLSAELCVITSQAVIDAFNLPRPL